MFAVFGVEVSRIVVVVIHPDYDPKEPADLGHFSILQSGCGKRAGVDGAEVELSMIGGEAVWFGGEG